MSVSAISDLRWEFEDIYVKNIHRFLVSENLQVYSRQAAITTILQLEGASVQELHWCNIVMLKGY